MGSSLSEGEITAIALQLSLYQSALCDYSSASSAGPVRTGAGGGAALAEVADASSSLSEAEINDIALQLSLRPTALCT